MTKLSVGESNSKGMGIERAFIMAIFVKHLEYQIGP